MVPTPKAANARLIEKPERFLSVVLFGNTLVNAAAAALATAIAVYYLEEQNGIIVATVCLTVILLIFCEATPKTVAARHAERLSMLLHKPIQMVSWLFTPFVIALSWLANAFTRIVGGTPVPRSIISDEEIRTMISVGREEGTVEEAEAKMLHKVFDFGDSPVHEIMVPRREVFALPGSLHNPLSRGCHALIRQGAKLTETLEHILEELGPLAMVSQTGQNASSPGHSLIGHNPDPQAHGLIENMGYGPIAIDELVERSGLTPEAVSAMLLTLELQGRVISSGGLYSRTD